jgi:cytoskeletal protein CcmA (bactofilin family)
MLQIHTEFAYRGGTRLDGHHLSAQISKAVGARGRHAEGEELMLAPSRRTLVRPPALSAQPDVPTAHLGRALTVRGVLDTDGEVHVAGNVLGRINADRLVVTSSGYVEGDVVARDVRILGRFNGRVFAFSVTLDSTADIIGRIFHHIATVAKGARIEGRMPWRPLNYFESFVQPPPENQP